MCCENYEIRCQQGDVFLRSRSGGTSIGGCAAAMGIAIPVRPCLKALHAQLGRLRYCNVSADGLLTFQHFAEMSV